MKPKLPCIWCLKAGPKSKEHIVPEVLGCPPGFVLNRGEVCKGCNNGALAKLDAVLGESFDFLRVWGRVPGKNGKPPRITGRTNLRGVATRRGHVELHFNLEKHAVPGGPLGTIPPASGSHRDVAGSMSREGDVATTSMQFTIGGHPDFGRAIHKIAFEWLVRLVSWEQVLDSDYGPIRSHVLEGLGNRQVLMLVPEDWRYYHEFPNRVWHDTEGCPLVEFILCGIPLVVSLGPGQATIQRIKGDLLRQRGESGWTCLPLTP
jgi:hypothetical protein